MSADIRFEDHGSIALIRPLTAAGREWAEAHIDAPSWAGTGGATACEPRYVSAIADGALEDGLEIEVVP